MILKNIISLLANRINQLHVIEYYLRKVYEKGFAEGIKQSPWISVEDRLPEIDTIVLTKGAYGYLICFLSTLGEWKTGANFNEERLGISHWMPIPPLESNSNGLERKEN